MQLPSVASAVPDRDVVRCADPVEAPRKSLVVAEGSQELIRGHLHKAGKVSGVALGQCNAAVYVIGKQVRLRNAQDGT
jgi:hypothetical protein